MQHLGSEVPADAVMLAQRFWPGPLTLVMHSSSSVPPEVTAGLDTVAIRIPAHPIAHALLTSSGLPVRGSERQSVLTPSPTRASHVLEDLDGRIDMVLDAGPTDVGVESTVLDLTSVPPTVLRPGAVGIEALREVIPDVLGQGTAIATMPSMRSPGLLPQHYAPRTPMTLYPTRSGIDRHIVRDGSVRPLQRAGASACWRPGRRARSSGHSRCHRRAWIRIRFAGDCGSHVCGPPRSRTPRALTSSRCAGLFYQSRIMASDSRPAAAGVRDTREADAHAATRRPNVAHRIRCA